MRFPFRKDTRKSPWPMAHGTSSENEAYTGAEWEITVDTDHRSIRVHDGSTAGGVLLSAKGQASGFDSVSDLLDDETLKYSAASGKRKVSENDYVEAGGFRYKVAASGASDHHVTTSGGVKLYAVENALGEITSTQLGWSTSGSIETSLDRMASYVAAAGRTIIVDDLYNITGGGWDIGADCTLRGRDNNSCGFKLLDANADNASDNGVSEFTGTRFTLGARSTAENLRITQDALDASAITNLGGNGKGTIFEIDGDGAKVTLCRWDNMQGLTVVNPTSASDVMVTWNHGQDAKQHIIAEEDSDNLQVKNNYFHGGYTNSGVHGDAIKTSSSSLGPSNMMVDGNTFDTMTRDALDTTGGFFRGQFTNNLCIACGLDLKGFFEAAGQLSSETRENAQSLVDGNVFFNGGIVFTIVWDLDTGTYPVQREKAPHDIIVSNNHCEGDGTISRFLYFKDAHNITWHGNTIIGAAELQIDGEQHDAGETASDGGDLKLTGLVGYNNRLTFNGNESSQGLNNFKDLRLHYSLIRVTSSDNEDFWDIRGDTEDVSLNDDFVHISGEIAYEAEAAASDCVFLLAGIDNAIIDLQAKSTYGTQPNYHGPFRVTQAMQSLTVRGHYEGFTVVARTTASIGTLNVENITLEGLVRGIESDADQSGNTARIRNADSDGVIIIEDRGGSSVAFGTGNQGALSQSHGPELTIASGEITATHKFHTVDTQSDGSTDDLDTINGGAIGDRLMIVAANSARTVVAKDGTGNLTLGADRTLDNATDTLVVEKRGDGNWHQVSFDNLGA